MKTHTLLNSVAVALMAGLLCPLALTAADPPKEQPKAEKKQAEKKPPARSEQTRPASRERGERGRSERPRTIYGLDEAQRKLYYEALSSSREKLERLGDEYRQATRELTELTLSDKATAASLREKAGKLAEIQTEMYAIRAKALATVAPSLKPEEREQLIERYGMEIIYGRIDRYGRRSGRGGDRRRDGR